MSIRNMLRKAAELVVDLPEDEQPSYSAAPQAEVPPAPARTVEQIVKESPGPNLNEIKVPVEQGLPAPAPNGRVDFAAVYARAGLPTASFSAEQALDVMTSLPAELPIDVKRKTVQATLQSMGKALGVNTESVVADASRKLAAIAAYGDALQHQVDTCLKASNDKIASLEAEIAKEKLGIEEMKRLLAEAQGSCMSETDRLDDVLEFFTLDVAPSRNAPK